MAERGQRLRFDLRWAPAAVQAQRRPCPPDAAVGGSVRGKCFRGCLENIACPLSVLRAVNVCVPQRRFDPGSRMTGVCYAIVFFA